jgi:hypothetical protein
VGKSNYAMRGDALRLVRTSERILSVETDAMRTEREAEAEHYARIAAEDDARAVVEWLASTQGGRWSGGRIALGKAIGWRRDRALSALDMATQLGMVAAVGSTRDRRWEVVG